MYRNAAAVQLPIVLWEDVEGEAQAHIVYIRCGLGGCSRTCIYILVFDLKSKLFLAAGFSRAKCGMALGEDEKAQLYDLLKPFGFLFPCV